MGTLSLVVPEVVPVALAAIAALLVLLLQRRHTERLSVGGVASAAKTGAAVAATAVRNGLTKSIQAAKAGLTGLFRKMGTSADDVSKDVSALKQLSGETLNEPINKLVKNVKETKGGIAWEIPGTFGDTVEEQTKRVMVMARVRELGGMANAKFQQAIDKLMSSKFGDKVNSLGFPKTWDEAWPVVKKVAGLVMAGVGSVVTVLFLYEQINSMMEDSGSDSSGSTQSSDSSSGGNWGWLVVGLGVVGCACICCIVLVAVLMMSRSSSNSGGNAG